MSSITESSNKNNSYNLVKIATAASELMNRVDPEWNSVSVALSGWNAFQLVQTVKTLESAIAARAELLALMQNANVQPRRVRRFNQRLLRALDETITRSMLLKYVHELRAVKAFAILLPVAPRLVAENTVDVATYSLTAYKNLTTQDPGRLLHPEPFTIKDKAYRLFKNTTTIVCLAGSTFALACSCNWMDKTEALYDRVIAAATVSLIADIADTAFQTINILATRTI